MLLSTFAIQYDLGVTSSVWPDDGIKSSPIFSKVAQNVPATVFSLNREIFKIAQTHQIFGLQIFMRNVVMKKFQKQPNLVTLDHAFLFISSRFENNGTFQYRPSSSVSKKKKRMLLEKMTLLTLKGIQEGRNLTKSKKIISNYT